MMDKSKIKRFIYNPYFVSGLFFVISLVTGVLLNQRYIWVELQFEWLNAVKVIPLYIIKNFIYKVKFPVWGLTLIFILIIAQFIIFRVPLKNLFKVSLKDEKVEILKLLGDFEILGHELLDEGQIVAELNMNLTHVKYHLEYLVDKEFVDCYYNVDFPTEYSLTNKGRKYIIKNRLIGN